MWSRLRFRTRVCGYLVGLGVTMAAVAAYILGWSKPLEHIALDFQLRRFNDLPGSPEIVHIDIDDAAPERVGRWPWPRDVHAGLVRTLSRAGARIIALDIVFSEPEAPNVRVANLTADADIEGAVEQLGELSAEDIVHTDDELAAAIREAGNVYLAMFFEPAWDTAARTPLRVATTERASDIIGRYHEDEALRGKIRRLLLKNFELDADEIAAQLNRRELDVRAVLPGVKRAAAFELVGRILDADPDVSFAEVHAALLNTPFDRQTADRADVLAAYRKQLSIRGMKHSCSTVPGGLVGCLPKVTELTPPLHKFARAARGNGFATFEPDRVDGTMRHLPLLIEYKGLLVKQLAFAVACDVLGIRDDQLTMSDGWLEIAAATGRPAMRIQLDSHKRMLVNWHRRSDRWQDSFRHIPVSRILQVHDREKKTRQNEIRKRYAIGRAVQIVKGQGFKNYRENVREMLNAKRKLRWAELRGSGETPEATEMRKGLETLQRQIHAEEEAAADFVKAAWAELKDTDPDDPQTGADYRRYQQANYLLFERCTELDAANAALRADIAQIECELRAEIADKICFVGYTATAVADFVTTPVFRPAPGVIVHSNTLNTFLQRRFIRWNQPVIGMLVILAAGVAMTLVTVSRGPIVSLTCVLLAIPGVFLVSAVWLFKGLGFWLTIILPLAVIFVSWAFITLYRQLSEEREKRKVAGVLGQYTNPQIAQQIVQSPDHRDLSPRQAEVTCFFSDLRGFTATSERLGPGKTRNLLNPYLEAMAEVLVERRAMVNKFVGDGIFAFFNSPLLACMDHPRQGCEAALICMEKLEQLKRQHSDDELAAEFASLHMRIGLSTGSVFVGDYGSENKRDYTCIGDTVNLAARLEPANKVFGTQIMVAAPTRHQAGDGYEFRYLGLLQVTGKQDAVGVFELLGRASEVPDEQRRHARLFGQAVELFQQRDWQRAAAAFRSCLASRSPDAAVDVYLRAIKSYISTPPPADWRGAISLTGK